MSDSTATSEEAPGTDQPGNRPIPVGFERFNVPAFVTFLETDPKPLSEASYALCNCRGKPRRILER